MISYDQSAFQKIVLLCTYDLSKVAFGREINNKDSCNILIDPKAAISDHHVFHSSRNLVIAKSLVDALIDSLTMHIKRQRSHCTTVLPQVVTNGDILLPLLNVLAACSISKLAPLGQRSWAVYQLATLIAKLVELDYQSDIKITFNSLKSLQYYLLSCPTRSLSHKKPVVSMSCHFDSGLVVVSTVCNRVYIWELATGGYHANMLDVEETDIMIDSDDVNLIYEKNKIRNYIGNLQFNANGKYFAGSKRGKIYFGVTSSNKRSVYTQTCHVTCLTWPRYHNVGPDEEKLQDYLLVGTENGDIFMLEVNSDETLHKRPMPTFQRPTAITSLAWHSISHCFVIASADGVVQIGSLFHLSNPIEIYRHPENCNITTTWDTSGRYLSVITANHDNSTVMIWLNDNTEFKLDFTIPLNR